MNQRLHERGQVLPLVAFAMVGLVAIAALAIDVGIWRYEREAAQIAADSGAIAAAVDIETTGSLSPYAAANIDATANGFPGGAASGVTNPAQNVTLTVNIPPATGPSATNTQAVEVIVTKKLPGYFGPAATVSARSVAIAQSTCLLALAPADAVAMNIFRGTLSMPNCGLMSNGQLALSDSGITPQPIIYAKTLGYRFWISYWFATTANAWPNARANAMADPCPRIPGCAYLASAPPLGCAIGAQGVTIAVPVSLVAGTYCNPTFAGSGTVTLAAGLYVFSGGFTSTLAQNFVGSGVTLYLTGKANFNAAAVSLSAPAVGPYASVLVFQASNAALNFNNAGNGTFTGLVYAPSSVVSICGDVSTCYRYQPAGGVAGTSVTWSSIVGWQINVNTLSNLNFTGMNNASGNGLSE